MDKSEAVIKFLQSCPLLKGDSLFFNFGNIENDAHQANINSDDTALSKPYIDGSVSRRFTFSIDNFKSVVYNSIVEGYSDNNIEEFKDVQNILDWINAQDTLHNYPEFSNQCVIEKMKSLTDKPYLAYVDNSKNPPTAVYRISIQIDYLDTSKCLWN